MGEVVVRGEKLLEVEEERVEEKEEEEEEEESRGGGGELKGLMRWEKFLPRMILRVLLVEADDSTRQIIAALLRKCSYKVAAVPDGLKAWEILKGRPHNIDLILTEVDLPSISGYALLTLIMEHEICKNIPVIMMSSQDSVSTVYKCMLRGAADYLVKPLRKNELRNLWQHVWRRQSSTIGVNGPQDESDAQQKVEATAENNAASNRSSGDAACIQRNKELIEKGSDAQSSCTKPDLEAESGPVDNVKEFSPLNCGEAYPSGTKTQEVETCIVLGQTLIMHDSHAGGLTVGISKNGDTRTTNGKDGDPEHFRSASISGEAHDNHYVQISSSKEAIDLIGAFHTHPNCSLKNSTINCTGKFDFSPQLDLSLRRSHPSNFENELSEERRTLMHSNASAFKRYTNRQLEASPAVLINFSDQQGEQRTNYEKSISHIATGCNSDSSTPSNQRCIISPVTAQSKDFEHATSHSQQEHSLPIPVKGVRFNDLCATYGSVLPPMFRTQSGSPSMPSPSSVVLLEPTFQVNAFYQSNIKENSSEQLYEPRGPNGNSGSNHIVYRQEHKSEHAEDRGHISPATDQSVSSSFCNGNASHLNSIGYGSNCGSSADIETDKKQLSNGKGPDTKTPGVRTGKVSSKEAKSKAPNASLGKSKSDIMSRGKASPGNRTTVTKSKSEKEEESRKRKEELLIQRQRRIAERSVSKKTGTETKTSLISAKKEKPKIYSSGEETKESQKPVLRKSTIDRLATARVSQKVSLSQTKSGPTKKPSLKANGVPLQKTAGTEKKKQSPKEVKSSNKKEDTKKTNGEPLVDNNAKAQNEMEGSVVLPVNSGALQSVEPNNNNFGLKDNGELSNTSSEKHAKHLISEREHVHENVGQLHMESSLPNHDHAFGGNLSSGEEVLKKLSSLPGDNKPQHITDVIINPIAASPSKPLTVSAVNSKVNQEIEESNAVSATVSEKQIATPPPSDQVMPEPVHSRKKWNSDEDSSKAAKGFRKLLFFGRKS